MNRLEKSVQESLAEGRKQLVAYIVAGDPAPDWTVVAMHGLVEAGVDVIELGVTHHSVIKWRCVSPSRNTITARLYAD